MSDFQIHDLDSAPENSRPMLEKVQQKFGFLPTILGAMAESPAALEGYLTISGIFEKADLTPAERQLALLTISRENNCQFCVAAHSKHGKGTGLSAEIVEAAREGTEIPDPKLNALRNFCRAMTVSRGQIDAGELRAFLDAGYTRQNALDIVLGISMKVITNYTDALAEVPLNEQLADEKWTAPKKAA